MVLRRVHVDRDHRAALRISGDRRDVRRGHDEDVACRRIDLRHCHDEIEPRAAVALLDPNRSRFDWIDALTFRRHRVDDGIPMIARSHEDRGGRHALEMIERGASRATHAPTISVLRDRDGDEDGCGDRAARRLPACVG